MKGFFQDDKGDRSMNRLGVFMGCVCGMAVTVAGIVHLFVREEVSASVGVILAGLAVYTGGMLIKNAGRNLENGEGK